MAKPMLPQVARKLLARLAQLQRRGEPEDRADFLALEALLRTGMRTEELVRVKPEQIDPDTGIVEVEACKGSIDHQVPLPRPFAKRLKTHLEAYGSLLGHRRGSDSPIDSQKRLMRDIWDRKKIYLGISGQGYSLHSLRSAFAMLIYVQTRDVLLTKELLGHRNINSTMSYVRMSQVVLNRREILKAVG